MMDLLLATSGGEAQAAGGGYVDDVFSAYTYTGNGSTQTINNGIDLAGEGGMVWFKRRDNGENHEIYDTVRGPVNQVLPNLTHFQTSEGELSAFNSSGFSLTAGGNINQNSFTYVSWTFRKAPKFFDIVTYTGNGASNRTLSHQLNTDVGMITVKATSTTGDWWVFHRSATGDLVLNTTAAQTASKANIPSATSSTFTVNGSANTNGVTYVAYLWAHDPSTEGIIQCGSYTGNGSTQAINLGWEPQYLLVKKSTANNATNRNWITIDSMRGWTVSGGVNALYPNLSGSETTGLDGVAPASTGFSLTSGSDNYNGSGETYIYLAIRRSNKPPTSGTQVYNAIARTGTGAAATVTGVGFAPDFSIIGRREGTTVNLHFADRLRGTSVLSNPKAVDAEYQTTNSITSYGMDGVTLGPGGSVNQSTMNFINHFFKRAKGFFDIVCDTGTGVAHGITHGLSVAPEFIIRKSRSGSTQWECWHSALAATEKLVLNSTAAKATDTAAWNSTFPTSTQFTVGTGANVNTSAATYVTYLFATLAGISKVGSYTGNGTSQTINCGFSAGARFFLVKATSTTGNWWVFDSARGIVSSFDPSLALNSTGAEVTSADAVDPDPSGIIVNQETTCSINATGVNYVFLAIA